jgi:hypothetical protein
MFRKLKLCTGEHKRLSAACRYPVYFSASNKDKEKGLKDRRKENRGKKKKVQVTV